MADGTDILDAATKAAQAIEALKEAGNLTEASRQVDLLEAAWKRAQRALNAAKEAGNASRAELDALTRAANSAKSAFEAASEALGGVAEAMRRANRNATEFGDEILGVEKALDKMGMKASPATTMLRSLFAELQAGSKAVGGAGALLFALGNDFTRGMIDPLASAEAQVGAFGAVAKHLNDVLKSQAEVVSIANRGVLAFGGSMGEAKEVAPLLADRIAIISANTGASKKEVGDWVKSMSEAGPGLKDMSDRTASAGGMIEKFEQQMLLAKRAGMSLADTQQLARTQFQNFGQSVEATSGNIALFLQLSRDTKLPVKDVMDQISAASTPFGIFGRQLNETANIWKSFAEGMKGLPISEVGKMVKTVSDNIANMRLETQAFVAQMSRMAQGATALGGALRMELEMRQPGGAERNLERVMQTITRMTGGRVITLQEAAQTPALETQFQMQRQMAGQMLGVQGGAQQSRLLEVLQGVQQGGIASASALTDISGLTEEGRKVQEQSVPLLTRIMTSVSRTPEMAEALNKIAAAPRGMVERAGAAAAAGRAGTAMDPRDVRMMGRHFAEGAQLFTAELKKSLPTLFDSLMARGTAIGTGAGSLRRREEWRRRQEAVGGAQEALVMRPLAPAVGALSPRMERQMQREGVLPPTYIRSGEPRIPVGTEGPVAGTPAERAAARRAAEAAPAAGERALTATPLEPPTVEIKVVCQKCLEKIVDKKLHLGNQGAAGEDYAR